MNPAGLLNGAWMLACLRESRAFRRATRRVATTQADVLATILRRNRQTEFGRAHRFEQLDSPRAYQACVPLSRYEDYAEAIRRIGDGRADVLTRDRVELLEPTSGSTGGEKLIPYTASLRRQFQRAVAAWVCDLFWHRPALRQGRAYWSISPAIATVRRTASGIPIGFEDDAAYLGTIEQRLLRRLLAVPAEVARLSQVDAFQYCTLGFLLLAADLTSISVWNPTFLTTLLAPLETWHDRLCFDLKHGRPDPPGAGTASLPEPIAAGWRGAERRAESLRAIFAGTGSWPERLQQIWPQLRLISCWADAGAGRYVEGLRALFPAVEIQPKGLLATEGCVSFPLLERPGAALAVRSHFFEFQPAGSPREVVLAHELQPEGRYRVIVTTGGGLYRYELRDEIEVVGFEEQCPLVRFVGKADCVSDLVGEKLSEPHVRAVLDEVFRRRGISPSFALLSPVAATPPRYALYLQSVALDRTDPTLPDALASAVERGLQENPHYAYARRLGQLAAAAVVVLDPHGEPGWETYCRRAADRGLRRGNIKPLLLDSQAIWGSGPGTAKDGPPGSPRG